MIRTLLLFAVMMQGVLFSKSPSPSLQALIVYDASPKNLKKAYGNDAKRIEKMVKSVASQTKLRLKMKVVNSKSLSEKNIQDWTRSQKDPSKTIYFFYYVGQGLLSPKMPSQHTSIGVRCKSKTGLSSMTCDEIVKRVKEKNPRLSIILFDCYNSLTRVPKYGICAGDPISTEPEKAFVKNISSLFLHSKGTITANAASSTEAATGLREAKPYGGLFTKHFLLALRQAKPGVTWEWLMSWVSYYCRYDAYRRQYPDINVDETIDDSWSYPTSGTKASKKKS